MARNPAQTAAAGAGTTQPFGMIKSAGAERVRGDPGRHPLPARPLITVRV